MFIEQGRKPGVWIDGRPAHDTTTADAQAAYDTLEDGEADEQGQGVEDVVSAIGQMIDTHGVEFFDESLSYEEFEKAWKEAGGPDE